MKPASRFKPPIIAGWALLGIAAWFAMLPRESPSIPDAPLPRTRVSGSGHSGFSTPAMPRGTRPSLNNGVDPPPEVFRQLVAGDDPGLQAAVSAWFAVDPLSVRKWLEAKPGIPRLQPVLSQLAKDIAASGKPVEALRWAERLQSGPERDQTLFEIYATGRRYRWLSDEAIRAAPFPPKQIEDLLSGAADD